MEKTIAISEIGSVDQENGYTIRIKDNYRKALTGLSGFSHVMVLWVFDRAQWDGKTLVMPPPYKKLKHDIGIFATRSPSRPNPVAVSTCRILSVDVEEGKVTVDWIDAENKSPVIDLKPYHPSEDIVRDISMPDWCSHWPSCREESGSFDWEGEFTFG